MAAAQKANGWGEGSQCLWGPRNQRWGPRKSLAVAQLFGRGGAKLTGGGGGLGRDREDMAAEAEWTECRKEMERGRSRARVKENDSEKDGDGKGLDGERGEGRARSGRPTMKGWRTVMGDMWWVGSVW